MILAAAILAVASLSTREARAADACVPPAVAAALADCSAAASLPVMSPADLLGPLRWATPPPGAPRKKKAPGSALDPRPFDAAETTLAGAYQRFACENKPPAGAAAARDPYTAIAYGRARLHFDAKHFQEAAVLFREIALGGDAQSGIFATQFYLEAINVLGTRGAEACYEDMARDVPAFLGLYCKDGREKANEEACGVLGRIQRDIQRLGAEQQIRAAERGERGAWARYEAAADRYMAIWNEYGRGPCEAKKPGCERAEEVLYNAARAYQAARAIDKSIATRKVLIDPRYNLQNTELAKKAIYEIGGMYHAVAEYGEAATWYERYARTLPRAEKAPEALQDAIVMRLGLGQIDAAIADADYFSKAYGSMRPANTARIAFALAQHQLDHGAWEDARRRLAAAMAMIDKNGDREIPFVAHAGLARALARLGKDKEAAAEHRKVQALFRGTAAARMRLGSSDDAADARALAKVLMAMGEATFFFAEEKRRAAEAIRLPAYTGSGRREDVAEFVRAKLAPAVVERRRAIDEAEKAYLEVLAIQPMPPPEWTIAAASRVARMHSLLAAEIRALPAPKAWKKQGASPWGATWEEVRAAWVELLEAASAPVEQRAKADHRRCADLSVTHQRSDAHTRRCWAWLERHYPAEHPRLDEIAGRPSHTAFGIDPRPAPEPER
jgi:tetratricopeptide (TPR) repeat protein